jgi:transposase
MSESFRLFSPERIEIVKWYAKYQNAAEVARQFEQHYDRSPPTRKTILNIARKFHEIGFIQDEPRSGRPRSVSTDENRETVHVIIYQMPLLTCINTTRRSRIKCVMTVKTSTVICD